MSTHKHIERICVVITVLSLLLAVLFINGETLGLSASARSMGYESTLFDTSRVHTIDIVIDDWDAFLETATSEEYATCSVIIDNDAVKNVAIRGKGNTSLSTVSSMGSQRYSFKIEFDHYETGKTYKGLDKLCLNNLIQDNTFMKDYLAYRLMAEFGADAPLCSFVWVTVNGEAWGLYLAVEAVENSFMQRLYSGEGDLYKPDSMSMGGGGPGNGRDFNLEDFINENADAMGFPWNRNSDDEDGAEAAAAPDLAENGGFPWNRDSDGEDGAEASAAPDQAENGGFPQPEGDGSGTWPQMPQQAPGSGKERPSRPDTSSGDGETRPGKPGGMGGGFGGGMPGGMGMGSSDVKLQYSDDDSESYSNIFGNAKSTVTEADKARLIRSLKALSEGETLEEVLDVDEVLRYFVVHNYLVNGDSYTGSMVHNYYLHEADGKLSMIPWDYNLAFGTFQAGDAASAVNDSIDTPLSVSGDGSRPMADWIFRSVEYTQLYHQYFSAFLDEVDIMSLIDEAQALIAPYVEQDPTAFCSYEKFEAGVATLRAFCEKRTESVRGQLDGTIPSTDEGQQADSSALIDASGLTLSAMGSMGGGGGGFGGGPGGGSGGPGASFGSGSGAQPGQGFPSPGSGSDEGAGFSGPPSFAPGGSQSAQTGGFGPPDMGGGSFQPPGSGTGAGFGGFSFDGMPGAAKTGSGGQSWLPVLLSAAVLAIGLLTAFLYKKRS